MQATSYPRSGIPTFDRASRFLTEPAIAYAAKHAAEQRCNPEQPELAKRPSTDEQRRTRAARRIDRRVGDGDAGQVNHHKRKSDRQPRKARPGLALGRAHDDE